MLLAALQNINGLPHFGVRWRVFFNTFVTVGIINFYCLVFLGKFPSLLKAATGMSSSMDIHSSYSSFCLMDDLQREVMKNKRRSSWDVWGKVVPRCFLTSRGKNSTNVNR
ncbi:hypothetical protein AVEN_235039-1 [Araneus ventricosus]|uniref:Uncharacterized protein n=1 Tax=Araneus ventricosus TaxID=182803 RepID=A0A4Y2BWV9_ARAVE|nr:hypothetical protein AVEN_235039-1 [Araneus ventricosus]